MFKGVQFSPLSVGAIKYIDCTSAKEQDPNKAQYGQRSAVVADM